MTSPVRVSESPPMTRATPKSVSFAGWARLVGWSGTSTLDGLTSRCTTPCAWAWPSASHSAIRDRDDVAVRQPAGLEQRRQRLAADELGDQVGTVVVDGRLVQGDDPRVGQPRGGAGLALEAAADDSLARAAILTATSRSSRSSCAHPDGAEGARRRGGAGADSGRARAPRPAARGTGAFMRLDARAVGSWLALMSRLFHVAAQVPAPSRCPALGAPASPCMAACQVAYPAASMVILSLSASPQGARKACRSSTRRTSPRRAANSSA